MIIPKEKGSYNKIRLFENLIYIIVWIVIFAVPVLYNRFYGNVIWENVFESWIDISAFLVIFAVNTFILVPLFLIRKKYFSYLSSVILVVAVFITVDTVIWKDLDSKKIKRMPPMEIGPGLPPMEFGKNMPLPEGFRLRSEQLKDPVQTKILDSLMIALLVVASSASIRLFLRWLIEENKTKELEKEQLKSELSLLRNQASPHFLMNTLNNIHALIDIDTEKAKNAVIKLSNLMRYQLYEIKSGRTSLFKEIVFIESYFELMKLRYSDGIDLKFEVPATVPEIQMPPMILITLLENAFKHGVSYNKVSSVLFRVEVKDEMIVCNVKNTKHQGVAKPKDKYSGLGLENVKKTLDLVYGEEYSLEISDRDAEFEVLLKIPVIS